MDIHAKITLNKDKHTNSLKYIEARFKCLFTHQKITTLEINSISVILTYDINLITEF